MSLFSILDGGNNNVPFDFNINNYSKQDLERLFNLDSYNYPYDRNTINTNESAIINKLHYVNYDSNKKQDIYQFITHAKNKLIDSIKQTETTMSNLYNMNGELKTSQTITGNGAFIIEQPRTPYMNSKPSEYFQGVLNPLDRRTIKKNITIDSRFRENYYSSLSTNFTVDLPIQFNKTVSMELSSIELPTSFYVFSNKNGNTFFSIIIDDTQEQEVITIQDGNYSITELIAYINNQISLLPIPYSYITLACNLTQDLSGSGNTMFSISSISPYIFSYTLNFQSDCEGNPDLGTPLPLKLGWYLGFRQGLYTGNFNYVSEACPDIVGSRYFFLSVDEYANNKSDTFYSIFTNSFLSKNILARISNNVASYCSLNKDGLSLTTNKRYYFGPVSIKKLKIQLLNEYGQVVDLNNNEFSFSINIESQYDI